MRSHDPFKVGSRVRKIVTRDGPNGRERLYEAAPSNDPRNKGRFFRFSNYYLGTSVADVIGCNLACPFCWAIDSHRRYSKIRETGKFYSPAEVAGALIETAKGFNCTYLRITQGGPTLDMEHLVKVIDNLELLESPYVFILETNGLLLGKYRKFAKKYARAHLYEARELE